MKPPTDLFADIPDNLPEELLQTLLDRPNLRVERIVSHGHASPEGFWYDQERHEWVVVLRGAARLRFADEDQPRTLKTGDYFNIPAHRRHRVEWTTPDEPTIWLALFYD
ncbi:MAG: cupin domain-containing protein [Planctomycetia bacterium]|nr:cupin domain-containing protein [Planctomycetia bacterium]